jgi:hypothetical protein
LPGFKQASRAQVIGVHTIETVALTSPLQSAARNMAYYLAGGKQSEA